MTKDQLKEYAGLVKDLARIQTMLTRQEKKAQAIPIVKEKVQSSQKEWPFIKTHITVEAVEPRRNAAILKTMALLKKREAEVEEKILEIEEFIASVQEARTRAILQAVIFEGKSQKDTAIQFDLTESAISKIISGALDKK